jgi:hypothetical protein
LAFAAPALSSGSYTIYVTNSNGGTGILVSGLVYSGLPTFTTTAGTLGTVYETANINTAVVATGDAPITYTLLSGTLPAGANINSNGTITGTAPVDGSSTTYSFTIQATDGQLQDSTRAFTLTINTDVLSWGLANNTVYALDGNVVMSNVALSATSSANSNSAVTFAANTLPTGVSLSGNTIFGTPTVEETVYTAVTATATQTGRTATRFVSWTVSLGDPYWKYTSVLITGNTATTFITDTSLNNLVMTPVGDVRANKFDPYTSGYYSNFFDGNGDYLQIPDNAAFVVGTGDFTIEAWIYPTQVAASEAPIFKLHSAGSIMELRQNTNKLDCYLSQVDSSLTVSSGTITMAANTWNHVAFVRTGTTTYTFVNGVLDQTKTSQTQNLTTTVTTKRIGGNQNAGYFFSGYISNFRFIKGTALYTANFTPSTTPLTAIANTSLLTCSENRLVDDSLNNHTITKNGDVSVSSFIPFASSANTTINTLYSTYFDGTGDSLATPAGLSTAMGGGFAGNIVSFECWVYPIDFNFGGYDQAITGAYAAASASGRWIITLQKTASLTTTLAFRYTTSISTEAQVVSTTAAILQNQWNHIAVTIDATTSSSSTIKLFANGALLNTFSAVNLSVQTAYYTPPFIGSSGSTAYVSELTGSISNFRILKGALAYTGTYTVPTAPLTAIANTVLLTCQDATLKDNSTNAFAITSNGGARPIPVSPFTQVTTALNTTFLGSGYFDGTGDYLAGPTSNASLLMGTGDFTIEYWVYKTTATIVATVVSYGGSAGNLRHFMDNVTPTIWDGSSQLGGGNTINLNSWNHIVVQRSGTTLRFYTNGISSATITNSSNFNAGTLVIGGGDANVMTGYIADLRITKGIALYSANFAPPAQPLTAVANTQLLTLQTCQPATNKMFIDTSNNNFPIANVANTTQGTFSPYGDNWSNYFTGASTSYIQTPASSTTAILGASGITTTSTFTVECWIYQIQRQTGLVNPVLIGDQGVNGSLYWTFGPDSAGKLAFYHYTGTTLSATGNDTIPLNTWTHIAVSISSGAIKLFVNGNLQTITGTSTTGAQSGGFGYLLIGGFYNFTSTHAYIGNLSNLRIVKSALYSTTFTPSTTPLTPITNTGLLMCQSSRFIDNSPNAFALTTGSTLSVQRFSPFNPVIQTPQSYSGYFDGTGDYLTVGSNAAFGFGTGDFTIEFWAYSTSSARQDWIDISDGSNRVLFYYSPEGAVSFYGNGGLRIAGSAITLNTWTHYAISKSSGSTKMFVNGVQAGSTYDTSQNYGTASSVTIGKDSFGSTHITGHMSNLRIVKGTAVYTSNFTPSTTPLTAVANTSLLTCQSSTFIDNSTNAFTLTPFGDVKPRTFNPFGFTDTKGQSYTPALYGGSAYFDGVGDHLFTPATQQFTSAGDFTIELSFYLTSLAATNHLIGNYTANLTTDWLIEVINTGTMQVFLNGSTNRLTHTGLTVNQWYHLSISRTGTTVTGRINGANFNSTSTYTMSGTLGSATKAIYLGMRAGSSNPLFGYISDVRLISGTNVYPTPFVPSNVPLTTTANTSLLLNMDKAGIIDASRSAVFENTGDTKIAFETPYAGSYYSNYFDGTGDYLTTPANAAFGFGTGDFTVEFWVNFTTTTGRQDLVWWGVDGANRGGLIWNLTAGNLTYYISPTVANAINYAWTPVTGIWYHIAFVRNSGSSKLYINGVQGGSTYADTKNYSTSNLVTIGRDNSAASSYLTGYISNLRMVNGTAVYTSTFTPSTTPLTAVTNTSLLTCQSKSFVDNSTNAFTITRNGDVIVKSVNPFQRNNQSSIYFDGTTDYLLAPTSPNNATGTGNFTVEFWVLPTTFSNYRSMFGNSASAANATGWHCGLNASGNVFIYSNSAFKVTTSNAMTLNMWNHVAITRSGSTVTIYINGTSGGTWSLTTETFTDGRFIFGGAPPAGGSEWFAGYLADLRVTKGFARTITVPTSALRTN